MLSVDPYENIDCVAFSAAHVIIARRGRPDIRNGGDRPDAQL